MATKPKERTVVGKGKKASASNSHITSTKRTPEPSTTTTSSTHKTTSTTPSDRKIPSYLKPTVSSRLECPSPFKLPKSDAPNNKPISIRRTSLDKPLSSSNLTKPTQPSTSRLHKALVSPGPRERKLGSSVVSLKSTNPSKPISDRTSKTPRDGKTKPILAKSTSRTSTSGSTKKVANNHASANSTKAPRAIAETAQVSNVETEEVKEVTSQEVEVVKEENEEHEVELVSEISHVFESDDEHEHDQGLEGYDNHEPRSEADVEKVISTVPEEEAKEEPREEKTKDEHQEEENANQYEEYSAAEEVMVNEKENEDGVKIEDHRSENDNEEEVVEEKEPTEGGISEPVEEAKAEPTQQKQQLAVRGKGKRESQVSNDMIEETASKLMEAMKNKVRALAGAFQIVIDNQTSSK